ncbi:MAG: MMPL family transporter [Alphaproteobacteria bacterium]|nr:MMPL family transporter [Alphaproteobacteria bacterium]
MLVLVARLVTRHPWPVIAAFVVVGSLAGWFGAGVHRDLAATGLDDPTSEAVATRDALVALLGIGEPDLMVVAGDAQAPVDPGDVAATLGDTVAALRADPAVRRVTTPTDPGHKDLLAADGQRALLLIELHGGPRDKAEALDRLTATLHDAPVPVLVGGPTAAERTAQDLAVHDLERAELLALPVVALLLLLFFRGPFAAGLPLAVGVVAIPASFAVLRLLAHVTEVSVFALNVGTFIGTGLAIDYAMVLVQRFRDEVAHGASDVEAVTHMLRTSGRAIVVSGVTVAGSMLALLVFPLGLLRTIGIAGALVVVCAMVAALVMLPALLVVLGPRLGRTRNLPRDDGAWHRIAMTVMARPLLVTGVVLVVLAGLAAPALHLETIMPDVSTFPRDTDVRKVDEALDDPQGFGAESQTPILVLVRTEGSIITPAATQAVVDWVDKVQALPGIRKVETPFADGPLTQPKVAATFLKTPSLMPMQLRGALAATSKGDATVVRVVPEARWRSDAAAAAVRAVRGVDSPGVTTLVGGPTALISDARLALSDHLPLAVGLIVLVNLVLLFVAFGSVVVPIKAVLMNIASIGASFGALVWIFQDGHLTGLLAFEPPGGIDLTVPVIMFAVVFGLSMDYEVFLLSRIKEEMDRTGDNAHSVAAGLERTGSIITRAAALLIVVVLGFAAGRFLFVKELGAGMVVAITIDATIVRALLVPSTMALLGDANWWAPAPLKRLWSWLDLEIRE